MLDIMRRTWRVRAYGDFYGYMLVAEGAVDIMVEPELSLWDVAALVPIVTEAGGTFTDLNGQPGPAGGSAIATNGALHADVLDRLTSGGLTNRRRSEIAVYPRRMVSTGWLCLAAMIVAYGSANLLQSIAALRTTPHHSMHPSLLLRLAGQRTYLARPRMPGARIRARLLRPA